MMAQVNKLAMYLPGGRLFRGSNLRAFLTGIAEELETLQGKIDLYHDDFKPGNTQYFIEDWEQTVGIPDDCFPGTGDIDTRRRHILIKLASLGVQTAQDFIDVAALFGITVTIKSGSINGNFPVTFPMTFYQSDVAARFTIVVQHSQQTPNTFTLTFPFVFGDSALAITECLFNKLKPANAQVIFEQV